MKTVGERELTGQGWRDILEFLNALSGEYPIIEPPELPQMR